MTGFWQSVLSKVPGPLIDQARKVDGLMMDYSRLADDNNPRAKSLLGEIFQRRMVLAQSTPATALDLLILTFSAAQVAHMLRTMDFDLLDEPKLHHWATEIGNAMNSMQNLLEREAGATLDDLGFSFEGTVLN